METDKNPAKRRASFLSSPGFSSLRSVRLQKFPLIAILLCDATELVSVAADAKNLVVKRGIGARYWAGFAGFDRDGSKRGNFSEKFRFYGEILCKKNKGAALRRTRKKVARR